MKLHRNYTFSNNRQIWRIVPGGEGKLVIEERDLSTRAVFFSCIEMRTGKVILDSLQFEEKFWIGIEDVYKDVIFFHRYNRPDRKSTRLNSSHLGISYAVFCLKKKKHKK